jgi:hypothetical protein
VARRRRAAGRTRRARRRDRRDPAARTGALTGRHTLPGPFTHVRTCERARRCVTSPVPVRRAGSVVRA